MIENNSGSKKKNLPEWQSTRTPNLKRRNGKTYYAELKVNRKTYRRSLETARLEVARVKLHVVLNEIRASAEHAVPMRVCGFENLRGCLEEWHASQVCRPEIKQSTKDYNQRRYKDLIKTLPVDDIIKKVGAPEFRAWWKLVAEKFNAQYANNLLSVARAAVDMQVKAGLRRDNILLDFKRMKIPKTIKVLPSGAEMTAIIESMRTSERPTSEESADLVAWMAYTGMRPAEAMKMKWEDVGKDYVIVRQGIIGTKNYKERQIPIMAELTEQIARRRLPNGDMWSIASPKKGLTNACERSEVPHMSPYSLRHFFATRCLECGVDAPTVGKWLGHSDGGGLVMRTYGHVSDRHGLEIAKIVKLG